MFKARVNFPSVRAAIDLPRRAMESHTGVVCSEKEVRIRLRFVPVRHGFAGKAYAIHGAAQHTGLHYRFRYRTGQTLGAFRIPILQPSQNCEHPRCP